jgi:hypothetical protein
MNAQALRMMRVYGIEQVVIVDPDTITADTVEAMHTRSRAPTPRGMRMRRPDTSRGALRGCDARCDEIRGARLAARLHLGRGRNLSQPRRH